MPIERAIPQNHGDPGSGLVENAGVPGNGPATVVSEIYRDRLGTGEVEVVCTDGKCVPFCRHRKTALESVCCVQFSAVKASIAVDWR
jgi:hypothetical protein